MKKKFYWDAAAKATIQTIAAWVGLPFLFLVLMWVIAFYPFVALGICVAMAVAGTWWSFYDDARFYNDRWSDN